MDCNFYGREFPQKDDLVVAQITYMSREIVKAILLEFNDRDASVNLKDMTRKRKVRSLNKLGKVGDKEVFRVLFVDENKGYIDLSKRDIDDDDRKNVMSRFFEFKNIRSIAIGVSLRSNITDEERCNYYYELVEEIMEEDPLQEFPRDLIVQRVSSIHSESQIMLDLVRMILEAGMQDSYELESHLDIKCLTVDGVETIRKVLLDAQEKFNTAENEVDIRLINAPIYRVFCKSKKEDDGYSHLTALNQYIMENMKINRGTAKVEVAPRLVGNQK